MYKPGALIVSVIPALVGPIRHEGVRQSHRVLQAYREFFDHPGWTR